MMSEADLVRAVRSIRYSSKRLRNQRRAASVHGLAKAAGLDRLTVYNIAATGRMSPETANKLRAVLGPTLTC
jgi:predicted transcriptional regulator